MKVFIASIMLALSPAVQAADKPADTSPEHMEQTVRNAYGALALMCSLGLVNRPAMNWPEKITQLNVIEDTIPDPPVFEITNLTSGTIASVGDRKYKEFVDAKNGLKLAFQIATQGNDDNGVKSQWQYARLRWEEFQFPAGMTDDNSAFGMTMTELARIGSKEFTVPATYTHYVAFKVTAKWNGKATDPHKAIFFFGHDAKGNEVVAPQDILSGDQGLWWVLSHDVYPGGLLTGSKRTNSYIARWIKDNIAADSSCTAARSDLCCQNGRCGLAESRVGHDLALPLVKEPNN